MPNKIPNLPLIMIKVFLTVGALRAGRWVEGANELYFLLYKQPFRMKPSNINESKITQAFAVTFVNTVPLETSPGCNY